MIVRIRLAYLRALRKRMKISIILFSISASMLFAVSWLIMEPYMDTLLLLLQAGEYDAAERMVTSMPPLIRYSPAIISVALLLMATSIGLLGYVTHRIMRIEYMMLLDMVRLLLFVATLACAAATIFWAYLAEAFVSKNLERISALIPLIYFSDKMFRLCLAASGVAISVQLVRLREILSKTARTSWEKLTVLLILSILAFIIDIVFVLPILVYMYRRRIFLSFAYVGIAGRTGQS